MARGDHACYVDELGFSRSCGWRREGVHRRGRKGSANACGQYRRKGHRSVIRFDKRELLDELEQQREGDLRVRARRSAWDRREFNAARIENEPGSHIVAGDTKY